MPRIRLMHAKLHQVRVTNVNYVGSVTIDSELIDKVGILPLQEVEIWNVSNGNRLSTYVLREAPGSSIIINWQASQNTSYQIYGISRQKQ